MESNTINFNNATQIQNGRVQIATANFDINALASGTGLDAVKENELLSEISALRPDYNGGKPFIAFMSANVAGGVKVSCINVRKRDGSNLSILTLGANFDDGTENVDLDVKFNNKNDIKELGTRLQQDVNTAFLAHFSQYRRKDQQGNLVEGVEGLRWSITYIPQKAQQRKAAKAINRGIVNGSNQNQQQQQPTQVQNPSTQPLN